MNDSLVLPDISAILFAAFDMDGTLLGPDHDMHPDNIAALHNLRDNGIHVLLASGRNHDNISSWYRRLDLTGPIVSGNGALVKDFATGNIIQEAIVEPATALDVLALGRQIGITQVVDHTDGRAVVEHQSYWGDIVGERCGAALGIVDNIDDLCAAGPRKLLWVDDGETIAYWESELRRLLDGKAHICVSGAEYLEILPVATHKGTGVMAAADFLGMSRQYLVRLLDEKKLPSHKVGTHRRVRLKDLRAYAAVRNKDRRAILEGMFGAAKEAGLYD